MQNLKQGVKSFMFPPPNPSLMMLGKPFGFLDFSLPTFAMNLREC